MKRISHPFGFEFSAADSPRVRLGLQPFRVQDQNKKIYIGLKDPLELSGELVLLPHDLYYLLQFFDGSHSILDLTSEYKRQFGHILKVDRLKKMMKKMDESLLLDNKRSQKRIQNIQSAYRKQTFRTPVCIGSSYASEELDLRKEMDHYRRQASMADSLVQKFKGKHIKAMILPHIDPRLGGAAYAAAYAILQVAQPVDLFVILGISHQPTEHPFVLTMKDFQTPLGVVKTDFSCVRDVLANCATDFMKDEIVHRNEHSIEFQTLFLKHFHPADFKVCPVLCSFSHHLSANEKKQFDEFIVSMRSHLEHYVGSVCIIASVDFSHIGPYYGDNFLPDSYILTQVENSDKAVLNALASRDFAAFDHFFTRTNNKYNICGYPALRTLLELLPPSEATLLKYDNTIMDEQRSTVTFASMIFS